MLKSGLKSGDHQHEELNSSVIPNLPPQSVIVIDHSSKYHNVFSVDVKQSYPKVINQVAWG